MSADLPAEPEPGAPVPKDAVDPELVNLKRTTQIGLVTSVAVLVLCAVLAFRLWPDFQFAGEAAPRPTTVDAIAHGQVADESAVTVPVALERGAAVRVFKVKGVDELRLAPAAGGGDQVWFAINGDAWGAPREGGTYAGRLRRLSELPFEAAFRDQVRAQASPRYVSIAELQRALLAHDTHLTAVTGDGFDVSAGDAVDLVFPDPDAITVVASFDSKYPDVASWAKALADAGIAPPGAQPTQIHESDAIFEIDHPGVAASIQPALDKAHLYGASLQTVQRRYRAPWPLAADASGVTADGRSIAWSAFQVAAVHAARQLPGDPWIVIAGDAPDGYWYVRPLFIVLGLIAALFAWALVRTARRELLSPKVPTQA